MKKVVLEFVGELDAFGLDESEPFVVMVKAGASMSERPVIHAVRQQYRFLKDDEKLPVFRKWLQEQTDAGILMVDPNGDPWNSTYIDSAHKRGLRRAFEDARKGRVDEPAGFYEGTQAEFMRSGLMGNNSPKPSVRNLPSSRNICRSK